MANGKPSDPEEYVLRSGVRSGLKREFAFALKSQSDLPFSLARTRSGKSPIPSSSSFSSSSSRDTKRPKKKNKSDASPISPPPPPPPPSIEHQLPSLEVEIEVEVKVPMEEPGKEIAPSEEGAPVKTTSVVIDSQECLDTEGGDICLPQKSPRTVTRSALKVAFQESPPPPPAASTPRLSTVKAESVMETTTFDEILELDSRLPMEGEPKADCDLEGEPMEGEPKADCDLEGEPKADCDLAETVVPTEVNFQKEPQVDSAAMQKPTRRFTRSTLKVMPESSGLATPPPPRPPPPPPPECTGSLPETPVGSNGHEESKIDCTPLQSPTKRFTRSSLKTPPTELEGATSETVVQVNGQGPNSDCSLPDKPARRFTRSLIKTPLEDPAQAGISGTSSGAAVASGSSETTPNRKMELKLTKKIALKKLPSNVRELLGTGLLEGFPVKYNTCTGKQAGLDGVIKGNGVLCSCTICKGSRVVSAYNFELHANSTKKHPADFIFLENGKSLHDVLKACTSVPLDMLETAIQNAIGPLPPKKPSLCQKCKELFHTPYRGKFALFCSSCLDLKQRKKHLTPSPKAPSNAKSPSKLLVEGAIEGSSKNTSSQKKSIPGKLTRKDIGLHKLVFMDDILPEGTEVGYYVRGKVVQLSCCCYCWHFISELFYFNKIVTNYWQRLLEGYIKDSGIFCRCCNSVVSPSQFEAHAGRAARRKPYNNIYTSNGVSLHELSVSLSKGRKLSPSENDDLCSICADGGNLILCDLCPRAFHKDCVGLSSIPKGDWYCQYCHNLHQRESYLAHNDNAIAAGRVAGVDPIEQIIKRSIRIVSTSDDVGGCVLCRCHYFSKSKFDERTVLLCDQCEKEYHVGCLKEHNMGDLKELPEEEWFCCTDCNRIHAALQELLLRGSQPLEDLHAAIVNKKRTEKGLDKDADVDIRWRLLSGKACSADSKLLLSKAVSIFHESFDPIVDVATGRDLIPSMVYGRTVRDQDFGGMYCAVLTVNSSVVSAGILRVLGCDAAELPLVATSMENQGQGYFQSLFSCIERLLGSLKVKHFVLPAAEEAESIWTKKFGFSKITSEQLQEYTKGARMMVFQGTSILHKPVSCPQEPSQGGEGS